MNNTNEMLTACAHLTVKYTTEQASGGRVWGWWECSDCKSRFVPAEPSPVPQRGATKCARCGYSIALHSIEPPYDLNLPDDGYCEGFEHTKTAAPLPSPSGDQEKCGQPAEHLFWDRSLACVLPEGHDGEHKGGGNCFAHGEYVGRQCPQWPKCASDPQIYKPIASQSAERGREVTTDGRRDNAPTSAKEAIGSPEEIRADGLATFNALKKVRDRANATMIEPERDGSDNSS